MWQNAPKSHSFPSANAFVGAIRKRLRPRFRHLHCTVVKSPAGKAKLTAMMEALKGTAFDVPFVDAIVKANLATRFGGLLHRNSNADAKKKKHPEAIDFQLGEQMDGALNELRGCALQKGGGEGGGGLWKPPTKLMIEPTWRISDARIFDLIDVATQQKGPLAESANRRIKTSSTSQGRPATFLVDYFAAVVTTYDAAFCAATT